MSAIEMARPTQRFGSIVVIGGGCYGSYYVRQLRRARAAGAVEWKRVLVIDHDPHCRVAGELGRGDERGGAGALGISVVAAEWDSFLDRWLGSVADRATDAPAAGSVRDAIVPSPLMPHLLFDWVLRRARARWPHRGVGRAPLDVPPPVPWQRGSPAGTHYVSFAEWTCPVNCIEPQRCPVTRGPRDWSLPVAIRSYVDAERASGRSLAGPLVLHCTHRAYGVGMIDVSDVVEADRVVAAAGTSGPVRVLVGTMSHCHGALDLVAISAEGR